MAPKGTKAPAAAAAAPAPAHAPAAAAATKIQKKDGSAASELELTVAKIWADFEHTHQGKVDMKGLYFVSAKEVDIDGARKAVIIFVPPPKLAQVRKAQKTLVEELEKKLSQHVLVVANRTMVSPQTWSRSGKYTGVRSRSRSLKSVQEALLDDLVFPTEIAGKRLKVKMDGARLLKIRLSAKDQAHAEGKLETFRSVYKRLTSKDCVFEFA